MNRKIRAVWAIQASQKQDASGRPSCSQLIHNPLFILAFAFAGDSIVTVVVHFKKKVMPV
ncbi:MAG TPA: hypothetical protein VMV72_06245 [Verrucomicrobiae bacterium]|nr:hypothetical protein [Verrucomicrobiae bacterium]